MATAASAVQSTVPTTELMTVVMMTVLVTVTVFIAMTWISPVTVVKQVTVSSTIAAVMAVAVAVTKMGIVAVTEDKLSYGYVCRARHNWTDSSCHRDTGTGFVSGNVRSRCSAFCSGNVCDCGGHTRASRLL